MVWTREMIRFAQTDKGGNGVELLMKNEEMKTTYHSVKKK